MSALWLVKVVVGQLTGHWDGAGGAGEQLGLESRQHCQLVLQGEKATQV